MLKPTYDELVEENNRLKQQIDILKEHNKLLIRNKTPYMTNQRIDGIFYIRRAKMICEDKVIGIVQEEMNDSGETDWVIIPDYSVLDTIPNFGDISGIDLDLRLKEYIRDGVPSFVTERTIPDNRKGLVRVLAELGLEENDYYEVMCRNYGRCGKNNILVQRLDELQLENGNWEKVEKGLNTPTEKQKKKHGWG